ncbi:Fic family protein [Candidatus Clostridium helianthi]|uniref:Fic family protein n=1 Tax=Candidatus Clostridium helianthi TaxID=3381660 RepID=A0ABW8S108_9CLOT
MEILYNDIIRTWRDRKAEDLLNRFFVKFTYSSNKIANIETRLRDVESIFSEERVSGFNGDTITLKEIENHKNLCKNIFKLSKENNGKLSINLIKRFHFELMKGCYLEELLSKGEKPGEFKIDCNVGSLQGAVDIEENLDLLIKEINEVEINEDNVLKVVSYFHCCWWLGKVHLFACGNGRVGRMLLNYLLIGNNFPPIIVFYTDKEEYYLALEYFNTKNEISRMVEFLEVQSYKTWEKDYNVKLKCLKDFLD